MGNKSWFGVVKCVNVYKSMNTGNFSCGNYYLVIDGHILDDSGKPSFGKYTCINDLEGAFYAEFCQVLSLQCHLFPEFL